MSSKIKINSKKIVSDIRARASDFELMSKYRLSQEQFDRLLVALVEAGRLRREELMERGAFFDDPANRSQTRRLARTYLWRPLVIEDLKDPSNKGLVSDLSVMGFRTRGIRADIGDKKTFAILSNEFKSGRAINLSAACRWFRKDGADRKLWVAGFQIIHVSDDDLKSIRKIIAHYSESGESRRKFKRK
jgi:hypothetical protein